MSLLILIACALTLRTAYLEILAPRTDDVVGTILVWHSWEVDEALVLQEIIETYRNLHPDAQVILTPVEAEDLLERFEEAADIGFGPDLIIGPGEWIYPLAAAGLIESIDGRVQESTLERFLPVALDAVRYQDTLYGLPLAVHTLGLYYNKRVISDPATTLDELVAEAQTGVEIGLSTSFENAFWGIRTFGGRLFDEERRVILDQGGFANWLNWLKLAQDIPAFILSNDQGTLRALFAEGRLGYLVDSSRAWSELEESMDPAQVGVLPLPSGPTGSSAPFLRVESLLFSAASSDQQRALALDLGRFLTNAEQQTTLMRRTDRIPANDRVRINARLTPTIAAFANQARSAVPLPLGQEAAEILRLGNEAYTRVLEGLLTPAEAATEATVAINQAIGFEVTLDDGYRCESVGDFTLWHTWDAGEAEALDAILTGFSADCPNIYIRTEYVDQEEMLLRLTNASTTRERPDLLLLPHTLLLPLIDENIVRPLGPLLTGGGTADPELLQRYRPLSLNAFRVNERLYGLPISLRTEALVYNAERVQTPARTLSDLLVQAEGGNQLGMQLDFTELFWGIPAFGGQLANETTPIALDQTAFASWLAWLQLAEESGAVVLSEDETDLDQLFLDGRIAYRVVPPEIASQFAQALGTDVVDVATLPSGPDGDAGPLVTVNGFAISSGNERAVPPVLEFMRYATRADSQRLLLEISPTLPANTNVDVTTDPLLATYAEQLTTAVLYPNRSEMAAIVEFGGDGYIWVQSNVLTPEEAAAEVVELVNQASGFSAVAPDSISCAGSGSVQLWTPPIESSLAQALATTAETFNAVCPEISVEVRTFEATADQLAALNETPGNAVALVLGPGEWAEELADADVFMPVDNLLDATLLRRILPTALESLRANRQLYGLPLSVETTALYVNRSRVPAPATTLDELLNEAQIGRRVALLTDGTMALWGLGAFGGTPVSGPTTGTTVTPESAAESAVAWPGENALLEWFRWLQRAQTTPGVTLGDANGQSLALFANGRLAYYTGGPDLLAELRPALGQDLDVITLPNGPAGPATPLLQSQAIYFPTTFFGEGNVAERTQAALSFARYLVGVEAQTLLMEQAAQVPVNRLVNTLSFPLIAKFAAQTTTAIPYPSSTGPAFLDALDEATAQILSGQLSPERAAAQLSIILTQSEEN